ncbi:MAG: type IV pilus assembly protein PilM [Verrucomicrobiales bacterium]|nr:type IV pilus assembly protein PilM [Verrucomicrobiales bacterium]
MLNAKSFLSVDFGAGTLKLAEFDVTEAGALRLLRYAVKPLGLAGSQEAARDGVVQRGLQELMASKTFVGRQANVCAPGFHVFNKFVKLPPVDASKATQIIQYEAQQNVPFPLEEVVWDYQILGSLPSGELEVLLVAIKSAIVEKLFAGAEPAGMRLNLVDVSPAALCNAFRYNYGDVEGCSMLLDIGAKTSNVLFFEKDKFYCRSINIGANSITQEFAAEAKMPFVEAEKIKIAEGFVSLGGAYEEPDNPHQAAISKIARQVMTRLHIQVNQTIQFYRSQQGGKAPERLYLSGGASIMAYTAQFFAEKLNLSVEYFNPFRNVEIDPSVDLEDLAKYAHAFGEVVGLGLRNPTRCPVELNLMPRSILKRQQLNQKKPYFIGALVSLVLAIFAMGWFYDKVAGLRQDAINDRSPQVSGMETKDRQFKSAMSKLRSTQGDLDEFAGWTRERFLWIDIISEIRSAIERTEVGVAAEVPGIRPAVWVERMANEGLDPVIAGYRGGPLSGGPTGGNEPAPQMDELMMRRYGLLPPEGSSGGGGTAEPGPDTDWANYDPTAPASSGSTKDTNQIDTIDLTCRGVSWNPGADDKLSFRLVEELMRSSLFLGTSTNLTGTNVTHLDGGKNMDPSTGTFTFQVKLKLASPIKL